MHSKFLTIFTFLFVFSLSSTVQAFQKGLSYEGREILMKLQVDSIVIAKMEEYNIPGISIGLVFNNSIFYSKGYGVKDINEKNLVTEHSVFHTASISKLFTAQAVMNLIESNVIDLGDKLVELLPNLNYSDRRAEQITVRHLLNHTSGLPDVGNYHWANNHQAENSLKDYVDELRLKLKAAPSTKYLYSNLGYNILGRIIEVVTKTNFDDYLQEQILIKSGMMNSDFRYFMIDEALKTTPHTKSRLTGNIQVRKFYPYTREHAPSSTLNASAWDLSQWMIKFMQALISNKFTVYQQMLEPSFDNHANIGLGFQRYQVGDKKAVGHYGGDRGFRSFLMMVPEVSVGLVVLGNCDYSEDFRQEILYPIANLMLTGLRPD